MDRLIGCRIQTRRGRRRRSRFPAPRRSLATSSSRPSSVSRRRKSVSVLCIATTNPPANATPATAHRPPRAAFGLALVCPAVPLASSLRHGRRPAPLQPARSRLPADAFFSKILASPISRRRSDCGCRPTRRFVPNAASSASSTRSAPVRRAETSSHESPVLRDPRPVESAARPRQTTPAGPGATPTPALTGIRAQTGAACGNRRSLDSPGTRRRSATGRRHRRRICVRSSATSTPRCRRRTTGAPSAADRRAAHRAPRHPHPECAQDPNTRRPTRQRAGRSASPASGHWAEHTERLVREQLSASPSWASARSPRPTLDNVP